MRVESCGSIEPYLVGQGYFTDDDDKHIKGNGTPHMTLSDYRSEVWALKEGDTKKKLAVKINCLQRNATVSRLEQSQALIKKSEDEWKQPLQ